ncbi:MAG: hypothetical protein JST42_26280, partial [Bacteroidetes bacterium]|nr:hypothetical protein [Bacteroidota bacterium]
MRLLIVIVFLLSGGVFRPVTAQEDLGFVTEFRSGHRSDDGLPASRYLTSIRFQVLFGGIIIGKAQIDGFPDSLNFIFDTGCGSVSLDSVTAVRYGLAVRRGAAVIHGVAGICPQR